MVGWVVVSRGLCIAFSFVVVLGAYCVSVMFMIWCAFEADVKYGFPFSGMLEAIGSVWLVSG